MQRSLNIMENLFLVDLSNMRNARNYLIKTKGKNKMSKFIVLFAAILVAGCSMTCQKPSMYEPILHCDDCIWNND